MPGDFFAETYNVILFVSVLGSLTIMMSGCYVYHKWKHIKSKNAPAIVPTKPKRKLKRFLRRASSAASDLDQLGCGKGKNKSEVNGDYNTPDDDDDRLPRHFQDVDLEDDVFDNQESLGRTRRGKNGELRNALNSSASSQYYSIHL